MRGYIINTAWAIFGYDGTDWDRTRQVLMIAFGPLLGWVNHSPFIHSAPVLWVSVFWSMDWVLGSIRALRRRQWSPRKGFFSVVKWLVYVCTLAVAYGLRESQMFGGWAISGMIEAGILCAEGSSVIRNGAKLTGSKLMHFFADSLDARVAALEQQASGTGKQEETNAQTTDETR